MEKMKRAAKIAVGTGIVLLVLGFMMPWYFWEAELVDQTVAINPFGGGTAISGWQLITPGSLVRDVPSSHAPYVVRRDTSTAEVLKAIGVSWSVVPALVPAAVISVMALAIVSKRKGRSLLRDGIGLILVGGILALALLIWNPASPAPLESLTLQPIVGKVVTVLGALLVTTSGLLNVLMKHSENSIIAEAI
jgi:hypothetical protein